MQSAAKTVPEYLAELPDDRKTAISTLRKIIRKNLPQGYKEVMQYGMISYVVPLLLYPKGYLDKKDVPLPYAALASQKGYMAVYLTNIYQDKKAEGWFHEEYKKSGKKMDIGKSCVRFKKIDDVPLDLIGEAIGRISVADFIASYEKGRISKKKK